LSSFAEPTKNSECYTGEGTFENTLFTTAGQLEGGKDPLFSNRVLGEDAQRLGRFHVDWANAMDDVHVQEVLGALSRGDGRKSTFIEVGRVETFHDLLFGAANFQATSFQLVS
jgi:hypothetical protein